MCKFSVFDAEISEIVAPFHFKYICCCLQKWGGHAGGLGGGGLLEFMGGDVPLGPWNPQPIPELVQLNFATLY